MKEYKLVMKSEEELIESYKEAKELLIEIINEQSSEDQKKTRVIIEELEDLISETDFEKYFLIDENNDTIIDFWKDYESNLVHEFIFNEKKYIEITYTNSNDTECFLLFDYFGKKIIEECVTYEFIGNEIKILQKGYMIGKHYDFYDEEYWSIVGSDIEGVESIEFIEEKKIYLIDEKKIYDLGLNYVGTKPPEK
jgi:protease II